jgi:hypothetical protein
MTHHLTVASMKFLVFPTKQLQKTEDEETMLLNQNSQDGKGMVANMMTSGWWCWYHEHVLV